MSYEDMDRAIARLEGLVERHLDFCEECGEEPCDEYARLDLDLDDAQQAARDEWEANE